MARVINAPDPVRQLFLDDIELNPEMIWIDRVQSHNVAQTARYTIGGKLCVWSAPLLCGQPITLRSTNTQGWLTWDVVCELLKRSRRAGAQYTLRFVVDGVDEESYSVIFRHQDAPALLFDQLLYCYVHMEDTATNYYVGELRFTVMQPIVNSPCL